MALTDEEVQELQTEVLDIIKEKNEGQTYTTDKSGIEYKVIKEINNTTQAVTVAPIIKGQVDYTQTTIVVAGTQAPGGDINNHVLESGFNAVTARV